MGSVDNLLRDLVVIFDQLKIAYAIIGGFAVRSHGVPRATYDVDATLLLERDELTPLFDAVEKAGYEVPEIYRTGWVDDIEGMPLVKVVTFDRGKSLVGDIFLAESDFQRSVVDRRVLYSVEHIKAWVASIEDLILLKLLAGRPRDLADIADLLFLPGDIDLSYMRMWAAELGVSDKLKQALIEAQS